MSTDGRVPAAHAWYRAVMEATALKGWTKAELSERSGVSRSTIDNWAKNPRPPQARSVAAVADALGIDRAEAVRLAGIVDPPAAEPPSRISARLRREIHRELSPEDAARVIGLLEGTLVVTEPGERAGDASHPRRAG